MKKLANISSFESLATSNATFVNNSYARRPVNNSIFSKGTAGDVDRALMAKRGVALLKEGASILTQLGVRGAAIAAIATGSTANALYKIPKAIAGVVGGRYPNEDPGLIASFGKFARELTRFPLQFGDALSDDLDKWASKDEETIKRLRQIKAKGRRYKK